MLTWLRNRPARVRQAARPAVREQRTEDGDQKSEVGDQRSVVGGPQIEDMVPATIVTEAHVADEIPPPFFDDDDPAFLDLPEPNLFEETPPPLPQISFSLSTQHAALSTPKKNLVTALNELPPWPDRADPGRTEQLLEILRQLDRIAGDVCTALDSEREQPDALSLPRKSR